VGGFGTILSTSDGGRTWQEQTSGTGHLLNSVHFVSATTGWAVGDAGTILSTSDGGRTWQGQTSGTEYRLYSVHFVSATKGWAVGIFGTILSTSDGGRTWQEQTSGTGNSLNSVHFVSATTGWAVGDTGTILSTSDGGRTWQGQNSGTGSSLFSVHFVSATTGWVVADEGKILSTNDGGRTWQGQNSGTGSSLFSVHFISATTGWAVGRYGTILSTNDGGRTWQGQTSGTGNRLSSVHFVSATTGWAVGIPGTILSTNDGGRTWRGQTSGTGNWLYSVHFVSATTGWAVGIAGTILSTNDSGSTWIDTVPGRSFAPWCRLSWLLVLPLFLYIAFKRPKPVEAPQKSVADMLVSDRPVTARDPDPLDFKRVARGLSRFLRNENTQPPLTVAITGEWGSGKSSLMNLLMADLAGYGFRPVWFNAWHHQKEEHLLAALLENIRKQGIPPWWHFSGLGFRWRLFRIRAKQRWVLWGLILALLALILGYVAAHPTSLLNEIDALFSEAKEGASQPLHSWIVDVIKRFNLIQGGVVVSILAALVKLWRGLRAFGANPAALMASMTGKFRIRDLQEQVGFRNQFMREFNEVTSALNPRTMLIIIDDLDRCRPENVLEVLEAVNFLVSSGECFIVMGLDLLRVERCVGLGFKDVAEELVDDFCPTSVVERDDGKKRRAEFARQYLEKLINIEVPVPIPSSDQSRRLLASEENEPSGEQRTWLRLMRKAPTLIPHLFPPILVAGVLVGGFLLGRNLFESSPPNLDIVPERAPIESRGTTSGPVAEIGSWGRRDSLQEEETVPGEVIQPRERKRSLLLVYGVAVLLLALGVWRLSIPSDLIVKDSPEFVDALRIWHPLLIARRNTPRSVKRFVNRVRYFAMQQSSEDAGGSIWQRISRRIEAWAGAELEATPTSDQTSIPESILVALGAVHYVSPDLVPALCADSLRGVTTDAALDDAIRVKLFEVAQKHKSRFGNLPPKKEYQERFKEISAGIRIN
jgi:photosystem II stability/assembly factor-like uncharacterized protein